MLVLTARYRGWIEARYKTPVGRIARVSSGCHKKVASLQGCRVGVDVVTSGLCTVLYGGGPVGIAVGERIGYFGD
jgi:hypothetical protein